jgi:hypothetical protein
LSTEGLLGGDWAAVGRSLLVVEGKDVVNWEVDGGIQDKLDIPALN